MRWRDWVSARLAYLAIAIAVLLVGSAFRWVQAIVAFLVVAAVAPVVMSRRIFGRLSPLTTLISAAIILSVLQIVPLPNGLVALLSPIASALRDDGTQLMHTSARSTITFDVPGTLRAISYFLTLLGIAFISLRLAVSESGRYRLVASIASICTLAALVTGVHTLFGIGRLYGLFLPTNGPPVIGPLVNPNHLGCLMAVGVTTSIGLAAYKKQKSWLRAIWLACIVGCGLVGLATLSRGAVLALGAGGFVCICALVAQRWLAGSEAPRRRGTFLTSSLPIAIVTTCTVVLVLYAGSGGVTQQISNSSFNEIHAPRSKFAAWKSAATLIDESPWVGVGRGAFEPVFTRVHPASGYSTFSHVENEYLQAVVDWGIPGAGVLGIIGVWLVVVAFRRWRDGPLAAGALGAFVAVLLQSNVDYGVELLGLAAPITVLVATLTYVPLKKATPIELRIRRVLRIAHLLALVIAGCLLCASTTTSIDEDHMALADQRHVTLEKLRGPLERHPLDYFNYAVAAQLMMREHDGEAIRVLNHAMLLHPSHSGLHLMAAHILFETRHPEQATVEYALALPAAKHQRDIIVEVVKLFPTAQAAGALPTEQVWVNDIAADLAELKRNDVAQLWLRHVLDLHPQFLRACELLFELAVRMPDNAIEILNDRRCKGYEPSHSVKLAVARTLLDKRQFVQAAHFVERAENWATEDKVDAWLVLCDAEAGLSHYDEARKCLRRLELTGLAQERTAEVVGRLERLGLTQEQSLDSQPK